MKTRMITGHRGYDSELGDFQDRFTEAINNPPVDHFFQEIQFITPSEWIIAIILYGEMPS
jgi:hypothetical protein